MDDFFDFALKTKYTAAYPAVFTAAAMAAVYLVFIVLDSAEHEFSAAINVVFAVPFCTFSVYKFCKSAKKAVAAVCAYLVSDTMLFAACGAHFSLLFGVGITLLFCLVLRNTDLLIGYISVLAISVTFAVIFILLYERYTASLQAFAQIIEGRGALFGTLDNLSRLLFGDYFEGLFYHKSYSAATVVDGSITTGAVDIFKSADSPATSTAEFLTGRYFATVFIPLGVFAALFNRLKNEAVFAFLSALLLSVIFGDERLFYLLLLLVSPLLYVGSLIVIYLSYAVTAFVDIRIGFTNLPDIISMFRNMHKPVYFLVVGAVVALLSYFMCRLIAARFNLLSQDELPRDVKRLVNCLGGRENIVRISDGLVTVSNPNLIDILRLDCEIHENTVELYPDDFEIINRLPGKVS